MKAIRIHQHGGPEVLQIDEIGIPKPSIGEALIKVKTAGLNHLDLWVRNGVPGVSLPIILGSDGAGIIEDLGPHDNKIQKYSIGDSVFVVPFRSSLSFGESEELSKSYHILGEHLNGVQAEYIVSPIDYIMPKPKPLSWEETAAFPLAYMTAYHMLVKKLQLSSGQTVLIWGASSGVGSAAIQIAKLYHTTVITTAGSDVKSEYARQIGADEVINYNKKSVSQAIREMTNGAGVDVIFEHVGEKSWLHSLKSLKIGGKIVTCGATTGALVRLDLRHLFLKHQQIIGSTMGNRQDLLEICALINEGKLKPNVSHIFHHTDIQKAHGILENNEQQGKVIIQF